jgi:hypothetical protein
MANVNITTLTYGGVDFPFPSVRLRSHAIYDQTDRSLQGHSVQFHCTSILTGADVTAFQAVFFPAQKILSQPQQIFDWQVDGISMFRIVPSGTVPSPTEFEDRRYGPKPRVIDVRQIPGGRSARIEFEIEVFINFCGALASDVEEFWWQTSFNYDRNFYATRTIRGKYRVKAPLSAAEKFFDQVTDPKSLWPKLPRNFYRDSQRVDLSNDGLVLDFTVTDKQVWRTLPRPLTDGRATFRVDQRMAQVFKTLSCSFEAPMDVNKNVIVQFITALIRARFADAVNPTKKEWFSNFTIVNHEFENRVDVNVTSVTFAKRLLDPNDNLRLQIIADVAGVTPEAFGQKDEDDNILDEWTASDGFAEARGPTGTATIIPDAQPIWEVCQPDDPDSGDVPNFNLSDPFDPDTEESAPPADVVTDDEFVADDNDNLSEAHEEDTYTSYYETWKFILVHNVRIIPVVVKNVPDIIQQTTNPQLRIVQAGSATRINCPPTVPQPAFVGELGNEARVDMEELGTSTPNLMADGVAIAYKATWAYTMISATKRRIVGEFPLADDETAVSYPLNPMFTDDFNQEVAFVTLEHQVSDIEKDGQYDPPAA